MPKNSASARPRECRSNVCTTMAIAAGNMIAPPRPWSARNATIQVSAAPPRGVRPHNADAPAKMITPSTTILRFPCSGRSALGRTLTVHRRFHLLTIRSRQRPLRRVSADEFGDCGAEPLARVLLQEMAGALDHGMLEACRARYGSL